MTTLFHSDVECSAVTVIIILAPSITDTINSVVDLLAVLDCFVMCFFSTRIIHILYNFNSVEKVFKT